MAMAQPMAVPQPVGAPQHTAPPTPQPMGIAPSSEGGGPHPGARRSDPARAPLEPATQALSKRCWCTNGAPHGAQAPPTTPPGSHVGHRSRSCRWRRADRRPRRRSEHRPRRCSEHRDAARSAVAGASRRAGRNARSATSAPRAPFPTPLGAPLAPIGVERLSNAAALQRRLRPSNASVSERRARACAIATNDGNT